MNDSKSVININHPISKKPISLYREIGNGSFSSVRLGCCNMDTLEQEVHPTNETSMIYYAIKCINKKNSNQTGADIEREINILSKCSKLSFVASLHFTVESHDTQYIALEYCPNGDLYTLLSTKGITIKEAIRFLKEIATGLVELHHQDIIFHDLKIENICIDNNGILKLVDFGLAVLLDDSHLNPATGRREIISSSGTVEYAAPEIFLRSPHAFEADWWSYGVIAYELFCGELPFYKEFMSLEEQCEYIVNPKFQFHRNEIICEGSSYELFLSRFLEKNPMKRFGYDMVEESDFTWLLESTTPDLM